MKEPFTELHIDIAKQIILGRIEITSPNTVYFVTSAKITFEEIKEINKIGFDVVEISPKEDYSLGILLIWNKNLPAEVKEGIQI